MERSLFSLIIISLAFIISSCYCEDNEEWKEYLSNDKRIFYHSDKLYQSTWKKPLSSKIISRNDFSLSLGKGKAIKKIMLPPMVKLDVHPNFYIPKIPHDSEAITLTLQMDIRRMSLLTRHGSHWQGPMCVSLLIYPEQKGQVDSFISEMDENLKNHLRLHLVIAGDKWKAYPVNKMRNIALEGIETRWAFVLDADEDTIFNMHQYLIEVNRAAHKLGSERIRTSILALASWQWAGDLEGEYPTSKDSIKRLYELNIADCKAPHFYKAYKPVSFSMGDWLSLTEVTKTEYGDAYEPYFIAQVGTFPLFDERFAGFGADKAFLFLNMAATGYDLYVLPNVFTFVPDTRTVAMTHDPPSDPEFINQAHAELGEKYGCPNCGPFECVSMCPWIANKKGSKLVSTSSVSIKQKKNVMPEAISTKSFGKNSYSKQKMLTPIVGLVPTTATTEKGMITIKEIEEKFLKTKINQNQNDKVSKLIVEKNFMPENLISKKMI